MNALGSYLLELRNYHDLTHRQLADATGLSDRIISAWEKGRNVPAVDSLVTLINVLGGSLIDVARLVKRDATPEEGKMLAVLRCKHPVSLTDEERALFESLSPEKKRAILTLIRGQ